MSLCCFFLDWKQINNKEINDQSINQSINDGLEVANPHSSSLYSIPGWIDPFSLYLLFPYFTPRDGTPENCSRCTCIHVHMCVYFVKRQKTNCWRSELEKNKQTNNDNLTCKVLCSSANELQQNSNASSRILTVLLEILRVYIWPLRPFVFCLSFVNNSWNNVTIPSTNQRFWPDSGQILLHQYGISVAESQPFLRAKRPQWRRARRNGSFRKLLISSVFQNTQLHYFRDRVIVISLSLSFSQPILWDHVKSCVAPRIMGNVEVVYCNLKILVFVERGKPGYRKKTCQSKDEKEPVSYLDQYHTARYQQFLPYQPEHESCLQAPTNRRMVGLNCSLNPWG